MTVSYACVLDVYDCVNFEDEILLRGENLKPKKNRFFMKNGKVVHF